MPMFSEDLEIKKYAAELAGLTLERIDHPDSDEDRYYNREKYAIYDAAMAMAEYVKSHIPKDIIFDILQAAYDEPYVDLDGMHNLSLEYQYSVKPVLEKNSNGSGNKK